MTTIQHVRESTRFTNATLARWDDMQNGDDGDAFDMSTYSDKSVQVFGTFGVGGTLTVEGSNDGSNWAVLTDPQGNDLRLTAAKIELISEATRFVRPRVSAGDGTTDLTVLIFFKE
jgi:hypothetical protein